MAAKKDYTAITRAGRGQNTATRFIRSVGEYKSQKDFADDIRGNGLRVVHIFNGIVSDEEIEEWLFWNRKI